MTFSSRKRTENPILRFLSKFFWTMIWLGMVLLAEFALARLVYQDGTLIFVWVNFMTPYVYLPAYGVLLLAVFARRWRLAGVSVAVVLLHLVWIFPNFASAKPLPNLDDSVTTLRVFNANLRWDNSLKEEMIVEIREAEPDILLLQEYTPEWQEVFWGSDLFEIYPYRFEDVDSGIFSSAIWSRRPLVDMEIWRADNSPMLRATFELDGNKVRLYNIHPSPPLHNVETWNTQIESMILTLRAETLPTIAIGDFNLTQYNRWYSEMVKGRLRSAHTDRGRGWVTTWPNGLFSVTPARLDHALISAEILCLDIREGIGAGSDHKPLIVDLAINNS